jgi:hypothetical protein
MTLKTFLLERKLSNKNLKENNEKEIRKKIIEQKKEEEKLNNLIKEYWLKEDNKVKFRKVKKKTAWKNITFYEIREGNTIEGMIYNNKEVTPEPTKEDNFWVV